MLKKTFSLPSFTGSAEDWEMAWNEQTKDNIQQAVHKKCFLFISDPFYRTKIVDYS
jgi:hypothetical protein